MFDVEHDYLLEESAIGTCKAQCGQTAVSVPQTDVVNGAFGFWIGIILSRLSSIT